MKIKRIYYFGNKYVKDDSLAINVAEKLMTEMKKIEFVYVKDTFQLIDLDLKDALILDVADSITKVTLMSSDNVKSRGISTTHDFDLGFFLKLNDKKADIVAIPVNYGKEKAVTEAKSIILSLH